MLYRIRLLERNGEQEYSHDMLAEKDTIEEAEAAANDQAAHWYGDNPVYSFFNGAITVEVASVQEIAEV